MSVHSNRTCAAPDRTVEEAAIEFTHVDGARAEETGRPREACFELVHNRAYVQR